MDYIILINKNAVPVLIEASNNADPDTWFALEDESKHIRFKDEVQVKKLIEDDLYKKEVDRCHKNCGSKERPIYPIPRKEYMTIKVGQTFPLPTGYKVSFEDDCTLNECNCPNPAKEGHVKLAILSKLEEPYVVAKLEIPAEAVSKLESVVAPSEEVKLKEDYEDLAKTLHGRIRGTDQEYIICAAIWFDDGITTYVHEPRNIKSGFVICGRRHHNCFTTLAMLCGVRDKKKYLNEEQGFLTNTDRFVSRKEAGEIAFKAGQTKELRPTLFSEDLY